MRRSSKGLKRSFLLLPLLVTLAACAGGPDPEAAAPNHMYVHFAQVGALRDAVVAGDLAGTRAPARWLANHEGDDFPQPGAEAYLDQMRAEGLTILAQRGIIDVAASVARLGATCGTCHTALNGGPHIRPPAAPPEPPMPSAGSTPEAHMLRHVWASNRLWEGLIGPSEGSWTLGAAALNSPTLDFGPAASRPGRAEELAAMVTELAERARDAHTLDERAAVYGQLLQTCAECHEILGVQVGS